MMKTIPIAFALVAGATLAACTSRAQQERSDLLERPIDCAAAAETIADLTGVIPDTQERITSGVSLVLPPTFVLGAATGQLGTRSEIVTGGSADLIRARIAQIDAQCDNIVVTYAPADPS